MKIHNFWCLVACLFATSVLAEDPPPRLADLAFMSGHWVAPASDGAEEVWLGARGGTMTGSFRWVIPGGPLVLEYIVIQETGQGVTMRFKHLRPDYTAWEEVPNTYQLTEVGDGRAVFSYLGSNARVPQRFIYSRPAPDELHFRGESTGDDEPLVLEFVRVKN